MITDAFGGYYRGRRVLLTGHNGFVGSWTSRMLHALGAEVFGFSRTGHARHAALPQDMHAESGDITDADRLLTVVRRIRPEVVLHLAAQPLVSTAVAAPAATLRTNVLGSINILEAALQTDGVRSVLLLGTPGEPGAPLNGALDAYTASKVAGTAVAATYAHGPTQSAAGRVAAPLQVTVVRPGVVLGGDRTTGRLLTDVMQAVEDDRPVVLRHSEAQRHWQHVLDVAASALTHALPGEASGDPLVRDLRHASPQASVHRVVRAFLRSWGRPDWPVEAPGPPYGGATTAHHAGDAPDLVESFSGPEQVWGIKATVASAAAWYRSVSVDEEAALTETDVQIARFMDEAKHRDVPWANPVCPTVEEVL